MASSRRHSRIVFHSHLLSILLSTTLTIIIIIINHYYHRHQPYYHYYYQYYLIKWIKTYSYRHVAIHYSPQQAVTRTIEAS